jgi:hypothetical protein
VEPKHEYVLAGTHPHLAQLLVREIERQVDAERLSRRRVQRVDEGTAARLRVERGAQLASALPTRVIGIPVIFSPGSRRSTIVPG